MRPWGEKPTGPGLASPPVCRAPSLLGRHHQTGHSGPVMENTDGSRVTRCPACTWTKRELWADLGIGRAPVSWRTGAALPPPAISTQPCSRLSTWYKNTRFPVITWLRFRPPPAQSRSGSQYPFKGSSPPLGFPSPSVPSCWDPRCLWGCDPPGCSESRTKRQVCAGWWRPAGERPVLTCRPAGKLLVTFCQLQRCSREPPGQTLALCTPPPGQTKRALD